MVCNSESQATQFMGMEIQEPPTWNRCTIPPCLCRILGKIYDGQAGRTRPLTDQELMERTGWGKCHLRTVYTRLSWAGVTVQDLDVFLWACGLHPSKQRRAVWMVERVRRLGDFRKLRHLRPSTGWIEHQIVSLLDMVRRVCDEHNTIRD